MRKDAPDVKEKLVGLLNGVQHYGTICTRSQMDDRYASITEVSNTEVAERLIANGVTVQEWKPISEPPKETGHYLVNIHQENEEKGEQADFVLDAWYQVNGLLFVPKTAGWTLLNEWYDLTAQMLPFVTHWTERPQPPKGE